MIFSSPTQDHSTTAVCQKLRRLGSNTHGTLWGWGSSIFAGSIIIFLLGSWLTKMPLETGVPYQVADQSHPFRADATLGPSIIADYARGSWVSFLNLQTSSLAGWSQIIPTSVAVLLTKLLGSPAGWNAAFLFFVATNWLGAFALGRRLHCNLSESGALAAYFSSLPLLFSFVGGPSFDLFLAPLLLFLTLHFEGNLGHQSVLYVVTFVAVMLSNGLGATVALLLVVATTSRNLVLAGAQRGWFGVCKSGVLILLLLSVWIFGLRFLDGEQATFRSFEEFTFYGATPRRLFRPVSGSWEELILPAALNFPFRGFEFRSAWSLFSIGLAFILGSGVLLIWQIGKRRWSFGRAVEIHGVHRRVGLSSLGIFASAVVIRFPDEDWRVAFLPSFWAWLITPFTRYTGRLLPIAILLACIFLIASIPHSSRTLKRLMVICLVSMSAANLWSLPRMVDFIRYDILDRGELLSSEAGDTLVFSESVRAQTLRWRSDGERFVGPSFGLARESQWAAADLDAAMLEYFAYNCASARDFIELYGFSEVLLELNADARNSAHDVFANCGASFLEVVQGDESVTLAQLSGPPGRLRSDEVAGFVARSAVNESSSPFLTVLERFELGRTFILNVMAVGGAGSRFSSVELQVLVDGGDGRSNSVVWLCADAGRRSLVEGGTLSFGLNRLVVPAECFELRVFAAESDLDITVDPIVLVHR